MKGFNRSERKKLDLFLLFIVFLEGYVVLSTELLAIRETIPFLGSGTDTISIIIAAVLLPLAYGYHAGGTYRFQRTENGVPCSIRKKLLKNLLISTIILTVGLTYFCIDWFFRILFFIGISERLILTTLYVSIFMIVPVFLLGQTVPLVSNYFRTRNLSLFAGRILFFSTTGSFMGAVFCTLILMAIFGVHYAVTVTIACLFTLAVFLSQNLLNRTVLITGLCLILSLILNSQNTMRSMNIVKNNQYNTIQIFSTDDNTRYLSLNRNNFSAVYTENPNKEFENITLIQKLLLDPIKNDTAPLNILVIGAGGFIFGLNDTKNNYTFIDIDGSLQEVAEELFIKKPLTKNKVFKKIPARAFLKNSTKKYDLIFLDVFQAAFNFPEHLATQEFFTAVRENLRDDGYFAGNFYVASNMTDQFSRNLEATIRSIFPNINKAVIGSYNPWDVTNHQYRNVIYTARKYKPTKTNIYTDNLNRAAYDRGRD